MNHDEHQPDAASPAQTTQAAPDASPATPGTDTRLQELEAKYAEMSDAYLRAKAEAENTRRRAEDEMAKALLASSRSVEAQSLLAAFERYDDGPDAFTEVR